MNFMYSRYYRGQTRTKTLSTTTNFWSYALYQM